MNQLEKELDIKFNGRYNTTFSRANHWLITANKENLYTSQNYEESLNDLWKLKFNAYIKKENGIPSKLIFSDKLSLTVFMLRWG